MRCHVQEHIPLKRSQFGTRPPTKLDNIENLRVAVRIRCLAPRRFQLGESKNRSQAQRRREGMLRDREPELSTLTPHSLDKTECEGADLASTAA